MRFSYFDRLNALMVIALILGVLVTLTVLIHIYVSNEYTGYYAGGILLPFVAMLYLIRKRFVRIGECSITGESITFKTQHKIDVLLFSDITSYKITYSEGVGLRVILRDSKQVVFHAHESVQSCTELLEVCRMFEDSVKAYNSVRSQRIQRIPSFFEKQWGFRVLVAFSTLIVLGMGYVLFSGQQIQGSFFVALGSLFMLWNQYYATQSRQRRGTRRD